MATERCAFCPEKAGAFAAWKQNRSRGASLAWIGDRSDSGARVRWGGRVVVVADWSSRNLWGIRGVLTEQEVVRTWGKLFKKGQIDEETVRRAETLLDELRRESPLRHRLLGELEEVRRINNLN